MDAAVGERLIDERGYSVLQAEGINRNGSLGPLLVGSFLGILLFGILVMQIWNYHIRSPHDPMFLKVVAWSSFLGSLALTTAIFADSWHRFIPGSVAIVRDSMLASSELATTVITVLGLLSQIFFAWRIYELSRKRWLQALVCALAIMQFVAFVIVDVHAMVVEPPNDQFNFIISPSFSSAWIKDLSASIFIGASIACDWTITISMAVLLYPALKEAVFGQTRPILSTILVLTFETGIVSAILTTIMAGLSPSKAPSTQSMRLLFFYPSGALYSTWLLVSLGSRPSVGVGEQTTPTATSTGGRSPASGDLRFRVNTTQQQEIAVDLLTTVNGDPGDMDEASVKFEVPDDKQKTKENIELARA
ncbi:hypothetical protein EYR40_001615 [Pleurotus pulmonarius]|nr:hypothetical protein EYR38_004856 [Pleurotus pulmonarius]KAF4609262.1 hypothetical protein EYR40_001615 [Pleurotus pulmonarius]